MKIAIIGSTNGSVLRKILELRYIKSRINHIFVDRNCGLVKLAEDFNIDYTLIKEPNSLTFSDELCDAYQIDKFDLVISFYTKLFKGDILNKLEGKLINLHPSILPSFPGMHGFEDTVASGNCFFGSTIHFVDAGMDTGLPIIQTSRPYNYFFDVAKNRNLLFQDQCKSLVQVINWFEKGRVKITDHRVIIDGAIFQDSIFSPNLDFKVINEINF